MYRISCIYYYYHVQNKCGRWDVGSRKNNQLTVMTKKYALFVLLRCWWAARRL